MIHILIKGHNREPINEQGKRGRSLVCNSGFGATSLVRSRWIDYRASKSAFHVHFEVRGQVSQLSFDRATLIVHSNRP